MANLVIASHPPIDCTTLRHWSVAHFAAKCCTNQGHRYALAMQGCVLARILITVFFEFGNSDRSPERDFLENLIQKN
ncbi:hypothetical protein [Comamonas odontotermitis]|uniref:hypothetical protein n=1 Tax=Comamonas odontotermitis TaxID=379895 RepID=UPI003750D1D3